MKALVIFVSVLMTLPVLAADEPETDLDKVEAALKSDPDDPLLHYQKCYLLFANGKQQEAIDHASVAMCTCGAFCRMSRLSPAAVQLRLRQQPVWWMLTASSAFDQES